MKPVPRVLPPPPETPQPNVFPIEWESGGSITEDLFALAKREAWDPAQLPWDTLDEGIEGIVPVF